MFYDPSPILANILVLSSIVTTAFLSILVIDKLILPYVGGIFYRKIVSAVTIKYGLHCDIRGRWGSISVGVIFF